MGKTLVIGSADKDAGKTSLVVGLGRALGRRFGYMKPLGDRLFYRKKRLWDYDSALVIGLFGLDEDPEDISLGFEHAKLRYMYDEQATRSKLRELAASVGRGSELVLVEGARSLRYGSSVHLDALSVSRSLEARLVLVVAGGDDAILDELAFIKRYLDTRGVELGGVVANKVQDVGDFRDSNMDAISAMGIEVLGIVPFRAELCNMPLRYLSERLFAKVVAGEAGLDRVARNIFVGAMSAAAAMQNPLFKKEDKIIITSGDRSDMLLAALESHTAGIIITNNILPTANIISKAHDANVPLLLVPFDTYQTAKQIDGIEPLLTKEDGAKLSLLESLVREHVDVGALVGR